ncbi:MAG: hypothetical protein QXR87_06280 [Candidatus Hadarchaeales archaeon]
MGSCDLRKSNVVSYPERGPWGDSKYRGNTSGWLIRDLIMYYRPSSVLDPCEGSGTTGDVCRELGVEYTGLDLKSGFDVLSSPLPCRKWDMIFFHPPYWDIIRYSDDPRDLSTCKTFEEYMQKLLAAVRRLGEYLTEKGVLVVLIGDIRKNGQYYPLGAYIQVFHRSELKAKLIKIQHNVSSAGKRYSGEFIPIMHEEVLVLSGFRPITWAQLVLRALREVGGEATLGEIYRLLQDHPKRLTNPTWQATVRRTLQEVAKPVKRGTWRVEESLDRFL